MKKVAYLKIRTTLLITLLAAFAGSIAAQDDRRVTPSGSSGRRVALVIGNDSYASMPLHNARNLVTDQSRWYGLRDLTPAISAAITSICNVQLSDPAPTDTTVTKKAKSKR
jgi:hypothetical protein